MARETGATSASPLLLFAVPPLSTGRRRGLLGSLLAALLLVSALPPPPLRAAELLELRLDGLQLPIDLRDLEAWSRDPGSPQGDLGAWLDLLDPRQRLMLLRLLRAPLVRDRSLAQQLLDSWAGQRLLSSLGALLTTERGNAAPGLYRALMELLRRQEQVSTIELLRALPSRRLSLNLDGLLELAEGWRQQLRAQQQALQALRQLSLPRGGPLLTVTDGLALARGQTAGLRSSIVPPQSLELAVPHRTAPLRLQLWRPPQTRSPAPSQGPWLLLTPGLGGSSAQLAWLAAALRERGWPVLLLEHPGSDEIALRSWLEGRGQPPAAEAVLDRVHDLQAVVAAVDNGRLPRLGSSVVLVGHSLGSLTSLLAAGLRPEQGLQRRCDRVLATIPLINPSQLLQCQLPQLSLPPPQPMAQPLAALVSLNGFGSLLWPRQGLAELRAPALLLGGTLDLITPPLTEQLGLFRPGLHPRSRLVLLEGGSHFSPVRIAAGDRALFQLGQELVGVEPARIQALILSLSSDFLQRELRGHSGPLPAQRRQLGGVSASVLDQRAALRWRQGIQAAPAR